MKESAESPSFKTSAASVSRGLREAQQMIDTEEYRSAAEVFQSLLQQMPSVPMEGKWQRVWEQVHIGLTRCYQALGSATSAIPYLRDAIKLQPGSEKLRCMLATSYAQERQFTRALRALEQGISHGCDGPLVHHCLAEIYLQQQKIDEAIAECRRSLEQDQKQESVYQLLSEAYAQKSQPEESIAALRGALSANPKNTQYYLRIAEIHRNQGEIAQAISVLREARRRKPRSTDIREFLVECLQEAGEVDGVIQESKAALKIAPKSLFLLDMLAFARLQKGEIDGAIGTLRAALEVSPGDTMNRFKVAALHHQKGELLQAREEYRRILSLDHEGNFRQEVSEALLTIDQAQMQQVFMLSAENATFRVKLRRDIDATLAEYGFRMSDPAIATLKAMVIEGLLDGALPRFSGMVH